MTVASLARRLSLPLLFLLTLLLFAGCGGGGGSTPQQGGLVEPTPDPTKNGSIGGTISTMALYAQGGQDVGTIDNAYNAHIVLTNASNNAQVAETTSAPRGGYHFANVPPGAYNLTATVSAPYGVPITLTGSLSNVVVQGNIPTLGADLLLADPARTGHYRGTVKTAGGSAVPGATVSAIITGNDPSGYYVQIVLPSTADAQGHFAFTLPIDSFTYDAQNHVVSNSCSISGFSPTSFVSDAFISTMTAGEDRGNVDISLPAADTPAFPSVAMDGISVTLPDATALASQRATASRLAMARRLQTTGARLERLQQRARQPQSRFAGGFVENDVYFIPQSPVD